MTSGARRQRGAAPWGELLADYDVRKGRLWPLVLAWIALGPWIVRARRERSPAAPVRFADAR